MTVRAREHALLAAACSLLLAPSAHADTAIETETAQIGHQGEIGISNSLEFEKATDGKAMGTLSQVEYGITDRSEILIEPFFQVWEFPDDGPSVHGMGDLELTPSYEFLLEDGWVPALLAAFKLKVPTGSKKLSDSTGKFDYYPYLILGQHLGGWILNANLGVDFITPPKGSGMDHQLVWDVEFERQFFGSLTWFIEGYTDESGVAAGSTALEYAFNDTINAFVAFSYDAEKAVIVRPGFNLDF